MASGGKRQGAGKPKGATNHKRKLLSMAALASEITPLLVMQKSMERSWLKAIDEETGKDEAELRFREANMYAKELAPYIHSKMQPKGDDGTTSQKLEHKGVTFSIKPE
jgi:hypothetical protein